MHSLGVNGEWKVRGQPTNPGSPGKCPLKWCMYVYIGMHAGVSCITVLYCSILADVMRFHSFVYRPGQLYVGHLPELNQASSSNNDTVCVSKTSSDIVVHDHDSTSSVSSKEGSMDVEHFIEVEAL